MKKNVNYLAIVYVNGKCQVFECETQEQAAEHILSFKENPLIKSPFDIWIIYLREKMCEASTIKF